MRFLSFFVLFIFSAFIFWAIMIFAQSNNPSKTCQWVYDAYEKKQAISNKIIGKKIILLAGSNVLFGVDSKKIAQTFKMPVLNYAVNAGIELPYTLHVAKRVINQGDIILMPLEYPMYSYDGTPGAQMIDYIFSRDAAFFWKLSLKEQLYMLLHVEFKRVLQGFLCQGGEPVTSGLYGAHHMDDNGDQIDTDIKFQTPAMVNEIKHHSLNPETYSKSFNPGAMGWQYISDFMAYCKKKEVRVIFMPSTLMKHDLFFTNAGEKWLYENIAGEVGKRGGTYVGNPYDYMYDTALYFNTNFHLTAKGRRLRTDQMIRDLKEKCGLGLKCLAVEDEQ